MPAAIRLKFGNMDSNTQPQMGGDRLFPESGDQLTVEPLRPKPSRRAKELERLFEGLRYALATDLDLAKQEVLQKIREVSTSVDLIAQELAQEQRD